ncbi:MAG: histidinol-phosphatase HisJ family protein [Bacilli bacterium]|jgi:histidinol-phosphatase (PHP family)
MLDIHNHSYFSFDSKVRPLDAVNMAIKRGCSGFGFAEHIYLTDAVNIDSLKIKLHQYLEEVQQIKKKTSIPIFSGVEFNFFDKFDQEYAHLSKSLPFDYVINSVHWINGVDLYKSFVGKYPFEEAFALYLQEVKRSLFAQYDYQIVGHLGVIFKIYNIQPTDEFLEKYQKELRDIFNIIIEKNKVLEVNTATNGVNLCFANEYMLKLYYALGGRNISFGSDAHVLEHVYFRAEEVRKMLKGIGFNQITSFIKKTPVYEKI